MDMNDIFAFAILAITVFGACGVLCSRGFQRAEKDPSQAFAYFALSAALVLFSWWLAAYYLASSISRELSAPYSSF